MFAFLLFTLLAATPADGSTIFVTHVGKLDIVSRKIMNSTDSDFVHCTIILYENGNPFVYEATIPGGVQRRTLEQYYQHVQKLQSKHPKTGYSIQLLPPNEPYTPQQLYKMKKYANAQLGRPYSLRSWLAEKDVKGLHCSQYIGNIIAQSGRIRSFDYKESPGSLYKKLL